MSEENKKAQVVVPQQLQQVNAIVQAAVKLQNKANAAVTSESLDITASTKERDAHVLKVKEGRKQAGEIMQQLASLIDMIDPTVKFKNKMTSKGKASLVKDLTGSTAMSENYSTCIEQVCDDLLETADKQIDLIKGRGRSSADVAMAVDGRNSDKRMPRTENALKKPQHAWNQLIDNSYNVFVPNFTKKEHYIGAESLSDEF